MKFRIYAYVQLVVLVFYLIRPVMPYVEYAVNKEYIAKILCINRFEPTNCCEGKCYLEKQVKKSNDNNDPQDNNNGKRVQNENVKEFTNSNINIPGVFETIIILLINPETPFATRHIPAIFIPPKIKFLA